ncbi:LA_2272/LA_2273 family lipoprotein [Leptospira santarosai]|uniref:LA_2272/LA_2273 family lipoprotein n=1 Tax=Leptospira santarosai TaxID=28183 RepID=UPI0018AD104C|nr:hypothetical protein [Leptospira santarosai]
MLCTFVFDCGISVTERARLKIPSETETEVFRLNLFYGEVETLAELNVGIVNIVNEGMIGGQVGIVNVSKYHLYKNTYGAQVAIVNISYKDGAGIQTGIINVMIGNSNFLQAGIVNIGAGGFNLSIGAFNLSSRGVNIGILNDNSLGFNVGLINSGNGLLSVGAINIGKDGSFQVGILNFCKKGPIPIMIIVNYCSEPESKNLPPLRRRNKRSKQNRKPSVYRINIL